MIQHSCDANPSYYKLKLGLLGFMHDVLLLGKKLEFLKSWAIEKRIFHEILNYKIPNKLEFFFFSLFEYFFKKKKINHSATTHQDTYSWPFVALVVEPLWLHPLSIQWYCGCWLFMSLEGLSFILPGHTGSTLLGRLFTRTWPDDRSTSLISMQLYFK